MLEIRSLTKDFGANRALDDIDLTVERGTIHGLIGPNGSGKSTTMNLVSGFFPPTSGTVRFDGNDITGSPAHIIARHGVIRTFQITRLFGSLSVFEAVRMGALSAQKPSLNLRKWLPFRSGGSADAASQQAISRAGLNAYQDIAAGSLPGGLQRVVSIATALAADPSMLLLDEPLAGLNATEKAAVAERVEKLRDEGVTILLVEHDVRSVMRLCDQVTVINFGKLVQSGTPEEISQSDDVISAYLGTRRSTDA